MFSASGKNIKMTEGDWGIMLPITVSGITFAPEDAMLFTLKNAVNGTTILTKTFENVTGGTINLSFTEEESALLTPRNYVYSLDWYQNGAFYCNVIPEAQFTVTDKV